MAQHIEAFGKGPTAGFAFGVFADRVGELTAAPGRSLVGVDDFAAGGGDGLVDAANTGGDVLLARSQGGDDEHQFIVTTTFAHSSSCGDAPLVDAYGVAQ